MRFLLVSGFTMTLGATITSLAITRDRLFFIGIAAVVLGAVGVCGSLVVRRVDAVNRPADVAYELGFQMGYDRGWIEGRRVGGPAVVPIQSETSNVRF